MTTSVPSTSSAGEMASLVRSHDWSQSRLGPIENWPASLKLIVDIMLSSGFPMAVRWGPEFILIYNDAYKPILGEKHPMALGLPFREVWPEVQPRLGPLHEEILTGKNPGLFSEDLPLTIRRRGGKREEARFTVSYSPIPDSTAPSGIGGVLVTAIETTERMQVEAAVRDALEQAEQTIHDRDIARSELRRTTALFEAVIKMTPDLVFVKDLESRALLRNPAALFGKSWEQIEGQKESEWHQDQTEVEQVMANDRKVIESGTSMQFEEKFTTEKGVRTLLSTKSPLLDEHGKIVGTIGVSTDITERENRAKHIEFVMHELSHRSKNLLTIIQSITRQSIKQSSSLADFETRFVARLASLSRLHDLLIQKDWRGVSLRAIVDAEVQPFAEKRFQTEGPHIFLKPSVAQVFSMAFHELATNAAKYGALSNDSGTIQVTWSYLDPKKQKLCIKWEEIDGPAVVLPMRRGFGSVVLERTALQVPQGVASLEFHPKGVTWSVVVPTNSACARDDSFDA